MMDERISLDYGSGGKKTSQLIDEIILPLMGGPELSELGDAAVLKGPRASSSRRTASWYRPISSPEGT